MNIEIIDEFPAFLKGAPARRVALREDGAVGLVAAKPLTSPIQFQMQRPLNVDFLIGLARAVAAGAPGALTDPNALQDLAVGLLAAAAMSGRLSIELETAMSALGELADEATPGARP